MTSVSTPHQITGPQPFAIGSPIGSTTVAGTEGISFGDVVRILKQRKLTVIVTTIVLYVLVIVATILIAIYAPAYTSQAIFELEPPKTGDWLLPNEGQVNTKYMEQMLQTEAQKLKNLELMLKVVERPEVRDTAYFRWYESQAMQAAIGLQDDLTSAPIPNTRLIRVALSCRDKAEARTIVNAVVTAYLNTFQTQLKDAMRNQHDALKKTLDNLVYELEQKRSESRKFREGAEIPAMELRRHEARQYVVALRIRLSEIEATVAALQSQLDTIQGVDPSRLPLTAEHQLIIESDPILRYWRAQVENLDVELAARAQQLGPNHRDVALLRQRRQEYYDKETAKREELIAVVRARQVEFLRMQLAQARSVQGRLLEEFADVQAEERDLDRNIVAYEQMADDEFRLGEQISEVQLKLTEAGHAMKDESRVRLHLRQWPQEAIEPSRPRYMPYLGGGFLLALAGGIGLAFLREMTDKALRTPVDVARFCRLSVLGCIPLLDDEEAEEVEEIEDAVRKAPHSLVAEAFRRTRTNLQFSGPEESQRSLLITSPSPGDGKTAVAINLATTLAHSSLRVLLIDCNFRRPAIREAYAGTNSDGLSNVLIAQGKLEDFVTKTDLPTLDVLSSGPMPPTPAELLGSVRMRELIEQATKEYDRVILDGPPTLLISDATVLAMQVDGVVLVARADENTRGTLRRAREQLEGINARLVGAILNGVRTRAGGYFKKQYREFYDYTSEETIPAELPVPPPNSGSETPDKT
ncbi:MAG: polysaccharide biosynthesis tyrosine autokinase [Phycisphaerae bacterium]